MHTIPFQSLSILSLLLCFPLWNVALSKTIFSIADHFVNGIIVLPVSFAPCYEFWDSTKLCWYVKLWLIFLLFYNILLYIKIYLDLSVHSTVDYFHVFFYLKQCCYVYSCGSRNNFQSFLRSRLWDTWVGVFSFTRWCQDCFPKYVLPVWLFLPDTVLMLPLRP